MDSSATGGKVQGSDTTGLRGLRGPSLADLAREAAVSYSLIRKIAAGTRRPNAAVRAAVERLWNVPSWRVFGDACAREYRRRT